MGIFGTDYESIGDMFDGGGPGQSGDTYDNDNDPNNEVTGIAAFSNTITGNSHANDGYGDDNSSGQSPNYQVTMNDPSNGGQSNKVVGAAPTGIAAAIGFASPVGVIGKLSGWANGLDPEADINREGAGVVDGRQVYVNEKGMQYSYNFLGLPYEVKVQGDKVVDALSIKGDDGMTGYERMAQEARDRGDNDEADRIMEEAANNAIDEPTDDMALTPENILKWAQMSGVVTSNEEIKDILADPEAFLKNKGINLSDKIPELKEALGTTLDPNNPNYTLGDSPAYDATTVDNTATADGNIVGTTTGYTATTTADQMGTDATTVNAATGTVSDESLIDPMSNQIDVEGAATGKTVLGKALDGFATQNISMIIDTSTVEGKLLAQKLGEGNYTDSKATVLGQMEIISKEFKDANGNPRIPTWAQGQAREISRMMAFSGVTGTAATAAMSNAIMEATLGVAQQEAQFFQTLTIKNLDNRQQSIINKANILAQFEVANLDARQAALVNNAQAFLKTDLQNLTNEQQAEVINTQAMVNALLTDQAAINSQRLFTAETANDFEKFYDNMNTQIQQYNATQINAMAQFNAGEENAAARFNADLENQRQQFYANMQYNIDLANAKWRQTIETTNTTMAFEAASTDVKNTLDITNEAMNQLWDRVDSMLDYFFKGASTEASLEAQILAAELAAQAGQKSSSGGIWSVLGAWAGSGFKLPSDQRLKKNIEVYDTLPTGVKVYVWEWNEEAKRIGADKYPGFGVIAQEIQKTHPEAVFEGDNGYLMVNYGKVL